MKTKSSNKGNTNKKTGYLNRELEFFYLKDPGLKDIEAHYHEFHKVLVLLKGNLDYQIEGCTYNLMENDIVIVPAQALHRPILKPCDFYERLIIYVSKDYLLSHSDESSNLSDVINEATLHSKYVIRPSLYPGFNVGHIINELIEEMVSEGFGKEIYRNSLFLQLLIRLNRLSSSSGVMASVANSEDNKISEIISYINSNLSDDLSIDALSERFYISRYYLMHTFKEKTGYTLGSFISIKRLIYARELIESGMPVTEAAFACGYNSYSAFSRAYKKQFSSQKSTAFEEL